MFDPQIQTQRKSRQSLNQNTEGHTAQAHGHSHKSSIDTTSYGVSVPPSNDSHRKTHEIQLSCVSTSIEAGVSASNRSETEAHLVSGRASVMSQKQNQTYSCTGKTEDQ